MQFTTRKDDKSDIIASHVHATLKKVSTGDSVSPGKRCNVSRHLLHAIDPAILGGRLAAARRARHLTQQEVADKLQVARTTVVAMEKGARRPRAAELVVLAALFGRPASEFLQPENAGVPVDFLAQLHQTRQRRAAAGAELADDIGQVERLCRWYLELEGMNGALTTRRYPIPYDTSGTPPERAALEVATAERNRLDLGDGPIGDLWELLDTDLGLRVFAIPMREDRLAGMFIYADEVGGCIAVNANHPADHQRWSGVYEYGQFLTNRYQADTLILPNAPRSKAGQRFGDAFTRHFLLPATGLASRFDFMRRAKDSPVTPGDLLRLARLYGVPAQTLTWRLEELRLLPAGTWVRLMQQDHRSNELAQVVDVGARGAGPPRFPARYQTLAVQAFLAGKLSEGQLAERLLTDRVGARTVVDQTTTLEQPRADGLWSRMTLDLNQPIVAS